MEVDQAEQSRPQLRLPRWGAAGKSESRRDISPGPAIAEKNTVRQGTRSANISVKSVIMKTAACRLSTRCSTREPLGLALRNRLHALAPLFPAVSKLMNATVAADSPAR